MTKVAQRTHDYNVMENNRDKLIKQTGKSNLIDGGFVLLSTVLMNCTKMISNRLIELDETLREISLDLKNGL